MSASPAIISRSAWGANPLNTPAGSISVPARDIWLHHTASTGLHGASGMRSLQQGAINGGYVDLEYTYVVDTDGLIYMSRGPGKNTAATGPSNPYSHAICCMGNYETQGPSDVMLRAVASLLPYLKANGWSKTDQITGPHKAAPEMATACCGHYLIAAIPTINEIARSGKAPSPEPKKGGAMDLVPTPSGKGYWVVDSDGAVFAYGDARYYGGPNTLPAINAPIVGMAARPQGDGYWIAGSDGGIYAYGKAPYKGSMGGKHLNSPIVGIDAHSSGSGYWLLGADGGIFAFGSAPFHGAPTGLVA